MNILTPDNYTFDVDSIITDAMPDEMYCVLDLSEDGNSDYYFRHMNSIVTFNSMNADLEIGDKVIQVPLGWQILLGDEESGLMEMCTVENILNMKDPCAFVYNPIRSMYARYLPVRVLRVYTLATKVQIPMLARKNLLAIPLNKGDNPLCAYFADENEKIQDLYLGIGE